MKPESTTHGKSAGMFSGHVTEGLILVVDDESDVRKVCRLILERAGYDVIEAEDGNHAIEVVKAGENPLVVDVILTDIDMPKLNGIEAIQFFQREFPHKPIIVLTGKPNLEAATSLMRQGLVDYLVKPAENNALLAAVAKAMSQRGGHLG